MKNRRPFKKPLMRLPSNIIVKVQIAMVGGPVMLVYNEDKSIIEQLPIDARFNRECMRGRFKAFFWAKIDYARKGWYLTNREAPEQDW